MGKFSKMSYLAGLLDGEAYIGWNERSGRYEHVLFVITVDMTHEGIIDWLLTFGGSKQNIPPRVSHHKMKWRWSISGRKAYELYKKVEPLMKIKCGLDYKTTKAEKERRRNGKPNI